MTGGAECVGENEALVDAARKMRDLDVGALPICGEDNRLKGMVSDRDIVVRCIADGGDPKSMKAGELADGKAVTIGADDSVEEALRTMAQRTRYVVCQSSTGTTSLAWSARQTSLATCPKRRWVTSSRPSPADPGWGTGTG